MGSVDYVSRFRDCSLLVTYAKVYVGMVLHDTINLNNVMMGIKFQVMGIIVPL